MERLPVARQAVERSCNGIDETAGPGAMILVRPRNARGPIEIRYVDDRRQGVVSIVRYFDIETGALVREEPRGELR
jgi:hypothetical protein